MKVAILSDIHGNSTALDLVLTEARRMGVEHLLILGDLIGYYYDIRGVLDLLSSWPRTVIGGNHEAWLARTRADAADAAAYLEKYGSALRVALEILTPAELDELSTLPARSNFQAGETCFELCHGAPDNRDRYVYPTASNSELATCEIPGRIVLMGHTHYPMVSLRKNCILVNPGSVGQPRDIGGLAAWMIYDTSTGTFALRRCAYDTSALMTEARRRDPHLPYLSDILQRNRI